MMRFRCRVVVGTSLLVLLSDYLATAAFSPATRTKSVVWKDAAAVSPLFRQRASSSTLPPHPHVPPLSSSAEARSWPLLGKNERLKLRKQLTATTAAVTMTILISAGCLTMLPGTAHAAAAAARGRRSKAPPPPPPPTLLSRLQAATVSQKKFLPAVGAVTLASGAGILVGKAFSGKGRASSSTTNSNYSSGEGSIHQATVVQEPETPEERQRHETLVAEALERVRKRREQTLGILSPQERAHTRNVNDALERIKLRRASAAATTENNESMYAQSHQAAETEATNIFQKEDRERTAAYVNRILTREEKRANSNARRVGRNERPATDPMTPPQQQQSDVDTPLTPTPPLTTPPLSLNDAVDNQEGQRSTTPTLDDNNISTPPQTSTETTPKALSSSAMLQQPPPDSRVSEATPTTRPGRTDDGDNNNMDDVLQDPKSQSSSTDDVGVVAPEQTTVTAATKQADDTEVFQSTTSEKSESTPADQSPQSGAATTTLPSSMSTGLSDEEGPANSDNEDTLAENVRPAQPSALADSSTTASSVGTSTPLSSPAKLESVGDRLPKAHVSPESTATTESLELSAKESTNALTDSKSFDVMLPDNAQPFLESRSTSTPVTEDEDQGRSKGEGVDGDLLSTDAATLQDTLEMDEPQAPSETLSSATSDGNDVPGLLSAEMSVAKDFTVGSDALSDKPQSARETASSAYSGGEATVSKPHVDSLKYDKTTSEVSPIKKELDEDGTWETCPSESQSTFADTGTTPIDSSATARESSTKTEPETSPNEGSSNLPVEETGSDSSPVTQRDESSVVDGKKPKEDYMSSDSSLEDSAFTTLVDLGMVEVHQDPESTDYDSAKDDDFVE